MKVKHILGWQAISRTLCTLNSMSINIQMYFLAYIFSLHLVRCSPATTMDVWLYKQEEVYEDADDHPCHCTKNTFLKLKNASFFAKCSKVTRKMPSKRKKYRNYHTMVKCVRRLLRVLLRTGKHKKLNERYPHLVNCDIV